MKGTTKLALAVLVICFHYFHCGKVYLEDYILYPHDYKGIIMEEAQRDKVEPELVAAIILAESKYNKNVVSDPGAIGLMQIMPETANWVLEQQHKKPIDSKALKEPDVNISIGTWYVGHLLEEFKGNEILALAAYNAGRGHVEEWVKENHWSVETFNDINAIPFPETREYVNKVIAYRDKYRESYNRD